MANMIRRVILLITLLTIGFKASSQIVITEAALSPKGDKLAFIIDDGEKNEVLLYEFGPDSVSRITDSEGTPQELALKSSLNWLDGNRILMLSKHTGLFQQYILDLRDMSLTENGLTTSSEYDLAYCTQTGYVYYLQFKNAGETGIYRRKPGDSAASRVDADSQSFVLSQLTLSPDGRYVTVQSAPEMEAKIFATDNGEAVKDKLPLTNTIVWAWAPDGNSFLYSHASFDYNNRVSEYLYEYDINTKKSVSLGHDSNQFMMGAVWAPCADKYIYVKGTTGVIKVPGKDSGRQFQIEGKPVCWMPDCKRVVFINGEELFIFDTESGKQRTIY